MLAAGIVILREILIRLGLEQTTASSHDLLDGVALAAADLPEPGEPAVSLPCC